MYFMELALGQFTSRGPATCFTMARGWRGSSFTSDFQIDEFSTIQHSLRSKS